MHEQSPPAEEIAPGRESYFDARDALPKHKRADKEGLRRRRAQAGDGFFSDGKSAADGEEEIDDRGAAQGDRFGGGGWGLERSSRKLGNVQEEEEDSPRGLGDRANAGKGRLPDRAARPKGKQEGIPSPRRIRGWQYTAGDGQLAGIKEENSVERKELEDLLSEDFLPGANSGGGEAAGGHDALSSAGTPSEQTVGSPSVAISSAGREKLAGKSVGGGGAAAGKLLWSRASKEVAVDPTGSSPRQTEGEGTSAAGDVNTASPGAEARNRWRRVKHTLAFAHHMSQNVRTNSGDLLDLAREEQASQGSNRGGGAGGRAGAAAFEGAKLKGRFRAKGRKGMEGMLVRQNKSVITVVQDFYVACLKMPIVHFLIGVFLAPIALGLVFIPFYLVDRGGLAFDGVHLSHKIVVAKTRVSTLTNVFLYALSLSTTFGGAPVEAKSPYCLCVANLNALMGQFLFVFLSGAVFARMSQPSRPIRCSKMAIIRADDFVATPSTEHSETSKVFAVRLVLTGPPPCELVDAKICLTFRIFVKLPSGSMFCSTQDLDLVRPEVSYLRYGIMVRHVIDPKSPVYGHTMETLMEGDASFSLTVMGLERASMQPIFHLQDYFVCDGDVAWDADYLDFISINSEGNRVLDHSKIDLLRPNEGTKVCSRSAEVKNVQGVPTITPNQGKPNGWKAYGIGKARALHSKSSSFTRADW